MMELELGSLPICSISQDCAEAGREETGICHDADPRDAEAYLTAMPKAELHLHLEGTVSPSTLVSLSQRHDEKPLTMLEANALYAYKDFKHFLDIWAFVCQRIRTSHDYYLIARDMQATLASQGVKHAEVYVAVGSILTTRAFLRVDEVFAAIEKARLEAHQAYGISVLWIVDASLFDIAAELKHKYPAVVGVGIGGNEAAGPCRWFKDVYAEAKQRGLRLTAHCGEATGSEVGPIEIQDAVEMGVERLGHAYCAQYDEALMNELKVRHTALELNVTSNLCTNVCPEIGQHPIRKYFDRGLVCTINSDDPAMFGSNLISEYLLVHRNFNFSLADMKVFAENSFQHSFLGEDDRTRFVTMIRAY
ncbi:hypothetical protein LTR17_014325 [Elasticomyces elasticus]|nr:hypothetical protein LTR17_014325 [Elasticomyces elasticus]